MSTAAQPQGRSAACNRRAALLGAFASHGAVVSFLAGCAVAPPAAEELGPPLAGRLVVRVQASAERAAGSHSAGFEWRGNSERGELRLFTPLGTQLALARWAPGDVRLVTPDGKARFESLAALSEQVLGEALPLAAFGDWLAGRPWPLAPASPLAQGNGFAQLGFEVDLARRAEGRISATRAAPPPVAVLIVLDEPGRAP